MQTFKKTSNVFDISRLIMMSIKIREMREILEIQLWGNEGSFIWPVQMNRSANFASVYNV